MKKDNFRRLTGEALEEQIAGAVKALREGKSVIANCIIAAGLTVEESETGRFTIRPRHPFGTDNPDRPMMRNLFPAPRTETAGWPNAVLPPSDDDLEATMRLSKAAGEIRQRLLDPKSDFNVLLEKNRDLETARKARSTEGPRNSSEEEA